jgi:hypothetical protein
MTEGRIAHSLPPFCPLSLFCEVLLPIGLVLFLWWARDKCVSSGQCVRVTVAGWGGDVPPHSTSTVCDPSAKLADGTFVQCDPWSDYFAYTQTAGYVDWDDGGGGGGGRGGRKRKGGAMSFFDVLLEATHEQQRVALVVSDAVDRPKVEAMRSWITDHWYPGGHGPCREFKHNCKVACCTHPTRVDSFANITVGPCLSPRHHILPAPSTHH